MCQSLVAVKTFNFYCRKWFVFTAAGDCCFCVAGAAFEGLIACGGKIAVPFSIACGGKKSIACGGKWVSLMPGYTKPIACRSKRLGLGICTWQLLLEKAYLSSLGSRTLGSALENVAAIVNPENKPTKANWIISWPRVFEMSGKMFFNKGSLSDLMFWGAADKHNFRWLIWNSLH